MKIDNVNNEIKKKHLRDLCKLELMVDDLYVNVNNLLFTAEDINEKNKISGPIPEWLLPLILLCNMKNDPNSILNKEESNNEPINLDAID